MPLNLIREIRGFIYSIFILNAIALYPAHGQDGVIVYELPGGQRNYPAETRSSPGIQFGSPTPVGTLSGDLGRGRFPGREQSDAALAVERERRLLIAQQLSGNRDIKNISAEGVLDEYNLTKYKLSGDPDDLRLWQTRDATFKNLLASVYASLGALPPETLRERTAWELGRGFVVDADAESAQGHLPEAVYLMNLAEYFADIAVGIDPVTGTLRGAYEAVTGRDLISGAALDDFERGLALVSAATAGYGGRVVKGIEVLSAASRRTGGVGVLSRAYAYAHRVASTLARTRKSVVRVEEDRRALKVLTEAAAGPRMRVLTYPPERTSLSNSVGAMKATSYDLSKPPYNSTYNGGSFSRDEMNRIGEIFVGDNAVPFYDRSGKHIGIRNDVRGYKFPAPKGDNQIASANLIVYPDISKELKEHNKKLNIKTLSPGYLSSLHIMVSD